MLTTGMLPAKRITIGEKYSREIVSMARQIGLWLVEQKMAEKNFLPSHLFICISVLFEPQREKICLWGFPQSEIPTSLLSYRD